MKVRVDGGDVILMSDRSVLRLGIVLSYSMAINAFWVKSM